MAARDHAPSSSHFVGVEKYYKKYIDGNIAALADTLPVILAHCSQRKVLQNVYYG